jgi:hypothetical protein
MDHYANGSAFNVNLRESSVRVEKRR